MSSKELIKDILDSADQSVITEFFHSEISENTHQWDSEEVTEFRKEAEDKKVSFKHVDNYGGEGQGEDYWSVYKFITEHGEVYVKFEGFYASYHGADFNEWFFVEPKQVQVTQFVRV